MKASFCSCRVLSKLRKHIPSAVKRKIENSLRSSYSAAIFILLAFRYFRWSGSITFFSGILSVVSVDLYFGRWMVNYYQCLLSCIVGAFFGTLAGLVSFNRSIQLTLMFLGMLFLNRVAFFQRLARIIAMISCFFATLLPDVFNFATETVTFGLSMQTVFLLIFMPFTITGVCTLFPVPGLAITSMVRKFRRILANLKVIVMNVTHSFYDIDSMEVFNAEADILIAETKKVANYVESLMEFADNEAFLILPCGDLPALLHQLSEFVIQILDALQGMQRMLEIAPINLTHLKFAEYLKSSLSECALEIQGIITLIEKLLDHLDMFALWGRYWHGIFSRIRGYWCPSYVNKCRKTEAEAEVEAAEDMMSTMSSNPNSPTSPRESQIGDDAYREKLLNEYLTSVGRLHCILNKLVKEYADVRMNFVWHKLSHPNINSNEQSNSGEESSKYSYNIRYDSKLFSSASNNEYHIQPDDSDARIFISLEKHLQSIMQLHNIPVEGNLHLEEDIGKVISSETEHLSIKNVSYRSAYISRLIFVGNLVSNLDGMFQAKYVKLSYQTAIVKEYFRFQKYITTFFDFKVDIAFLETLIQPAKIAGAVTITAIFVVYPGVLGVDIQDALWPGITLCFIRQENSASSFLTSYQRLEGTVIGSFYVLFVYVILSNSTLTDDYGTSQFYLAYTGPLIVVWVSVCCYFREGPVHGFAAVTAAITPIVLLLGPFANNVTTLLFRVANTILGILIYLAIDIFILPTRTDSIVHKNVIKCMVQTANSVQKAVDAVHDLLCFYECSSENFNVGPNVTHRNTRASTAVDPVPVRLSPLPENSAVVFGVEYDSKDDIELQSMNSMTESVVTRGKNGFLSINNIDPNDETFQLELHDGFTACDEHLTSCRASLKIAKSIQAGLVMTLKNGVHEPEIFSKPFPLEQYTNLNESFKNLFPTIYSVAASSLALREALRSLEVGHEDIRAYLHMFRFMTNRLFEISRRATCALRCATEALRRLYEDDHPVVDMSEIISVNRLSDQLLLSVDEYFRSDYTKDIHFLSHKNALFAITWMNCFESLLALVRYLAALGKQLLLIRDIEAFCQ